MMRISKLLRQRRTDNGALTLASPEVKFTIDSENDPLDVGMYQVSVSTCLGWYVRSQTRQA